MKKVLIGLVAWPLVAGVALAAEPLTNQQMDTLTAGDALNLSIPTIPSITSILSTGGLSFTLPTGLLSAAPAPSPTPSPSPSATPSPSPSATPSPSPSPTPSPAPSPTPSPASSVGYAR
jgi:hypothetical protein